MSRSNPFRRHGQSGEAVDAASRIDMVGSFNPFKCQVALRMPGLQATVRQAIQRRLRQLDRERRK